MKANSLKLLEAADVFYGSDPGEPRELNMNDTFGWAYAFGEVVPDDRLDEVAGLFRRYGFAGLVYWVSEQNDGMRSEFEDVNRQIGFVRHEEKLRLQEPNSSTRAYMKLVYTLGGQP